jgi:NAD(P)-dependent dehydrogenase (short-subunit alcohol dehydrogenase family)
MTQPHQTPLADVRGKVAFITGGSSGIGLGIGRVLSAAGMKVVFTYMRESHRDAALASYPAGNPGVHALKLDIADRDGMVRAADEAGRVFGNVHLLVNNAGIGIASQVSTCTWNDWDWAVNTNINGIYSGIRTFLPRMLAHGEGGHLVTTASTAGLVAGMLGVYATTKYACMGMMESLRCELEGQNIGVSVFCPGLTKTQIFDTERNRPASYQNEGGPKHAAPPPGLKDAPPVDLMADAMDIMDAGELVLAGIRANDLFILSHPEWAQVTQERSDALQASFSNRPVPEGRVRATATIAPDLYAREAARRRRQDVV